MVTETENESNARILCWHLELMVSRLRQIPIDKLDTAEAVTAPTPRTIAVHAWQWLVCDRQHIAEVDASKHSRIPEPPSEIAALCEAIMAETENWRQLLRSLTPEQMDETRWQFNRPHRETTVRWFVSHMVQNAIYKSGQLAYVYFALGLDGPEPYDAPFPNAIYAEMFDTPV